MNLESNPLKSRVLATKIGRTLDREQIGSVGGHPPGERETLYVYMYIYIYIYTHMCIICISVCIYIYIYIHAHTRWEDGGRLARRTAGCRRLRVETSEGTSY